MRLTRRLRVALVFAVTSAISLALLAATPGLPFTEEFNDTLLRDTPRTSANWNTSQGVLAMPRRRPLQNFIDSAAAGTAIGNKSVSALSIALGDLDGDGDLDLVLVGGSDDRYFLNNGSSTPFTSSTSLVKFSNSNSKSGQVALEDFDRDGDLDVVVAKLIGSVKNLVYFNNGTDAPFLNVIPVELGSLSAVSGSVDTGDIDGDGDADIVVGNENTGDRYYLNLGNGTFSSELAITPPPVMKTKSLRLGDMDRDGRLDLVVATTLDPVDSPDGPRLDIAVGDVQGTYLYLNNGSSAPFSGVVPMRISEDENKLWDSGLLELGDLNGDGFLDVLVGNLGYDRVYLNNGSVPGLNPFAGVSGFNVSSDQRNTHSVVLVDIDADGDLDYLAGNKPRTHGLAADNVGTDRLYLNNGNGFFQPGMDISSDVNGPTTSLAVGDLDNDGDIDIAASRDQSIGRYFLNMGVQGSAAEVSQLRSYARSLRVDDGSIALNTVRLDANQTKPVHSRIRYWLSNDGGARWKIAYPGRSTQFGAAVVPRDLRWRAELMTASPASLPKINSLSLGMDLPMSVVISAPATGSSYSLGAAVSFSATATDPEDGNLSGSLSWSSSRDGVIGSGAAFSTSSLSAGTHTITASATDSNGASASASIVLTVVSGSGGGSGAFQQEADGSVSIEAEHYDANIEHNGAQWNGPLSLSGTSGGQAMEAPSAAAQPRLEYRVDFRDAGTYYVWIRSYAFNASSNSVHLGNDGSWFNDVVTVSPYNSWQWEGPFTLNVSSVGVHTLGISRRESLTQIDKLFVASRSNATPSGTGAPESARTGGGGGTSNTPPVAAIAAPATGSSYSLGATVSFSATATDPEDGNLSGSLSWSSSRDGVIGSGASFSTAALSAGTHTITASVTDSSGASASASIVLTVVSGGGGGGSGAFQQEADGSVSIEAEHYDANLEDGGMQWNGPVFPSGASGGQAMEAPDNGQPRLEYRVDFRTTGTYYVWIRSYAFGGSSNSLRFGSDGGWLDQLVTVSPYNSWQWEGPFTLDVSSTGAHTLGISRRESLTQVDKLFIGTSSSSAPSGIGPGESLR